MIIAPGTLCQVDTRTIATQAQSGLAKMLSCRGVKPKLPAMAGSEVENRKLKTYAITMPEITIGMKNTVRSGAFHLILLCRAIASANASAFATIVVTKANCRVKR